jgi:nitrate reductase gamma subunit
MKIDILFAASPYIAFSLLVIGIGMRYLLDRRQMPSVKKEMSEARSQFAGGPLWRVSLLLLVVAHLLGVVFPRAILWWNGNTSRLYLLEGAGLIVGVAALACGCALLYRHLRHSSGGLITELPDTVFFGLMFVGLLSGVLTAVLYRWGSAWSSVTLAPYMASLVRTKPAANLASQMPFLVRLHVFSAFAAVAVFPLTRLAAFVIFALNWAFVLLGRTFATTTRILEAWTRKHSPAAWLWPEED